MTEIIIDNILGGASMSDYFSSRGQFLNSIAIDPDLPKDDSSAKPAGLIRATSMAKFSASELTGAGMFFISNPKTAKVYLYANDGKVHTIEDA